MEICRNLSVEILDGMAQEYRENAAYERIIRKFMALALLRKSLFIDLIPFAEKNRQLLNMIKRYGQPEYPLNAYIDAVSHYVLQLD